VLSIAMIIATLCIFLEKLNEGIGNALTKIGMQHSRLY
jgi:hypothetical protein